MASTLTRVVNVYRNDQTDLTYPDAGWVGSVAGVKNDLVYLNSGVVTPLAATSATTSSSRRAGVLGRSLASTVAAATVVPVEKLSEECRLELPIATDSGGSVGTPVGIATPSTTLPTIIGNQYGISRDSLGTYYVNTNVTSSAVLFEITEIGPTYPSSDAFPTVIGKIVAANRMG